MGIEVFDRQAFHLSEQFFAHPGYGALPDLIQQNIFDVSSRYPCQVNACQYQQDAYQSVEVSRQDVVIDNRPEHVRSGEIGCDAHNDQYTDYDQQPSVAGHV